MKIFMVLNKWNLWALKKSFRIHSSYGFISDALTFSNFKVIVLVYLGFKIFYFSSILNFLRCEGFIDWGKKILKSIMQCKEIVRRVAEKFKRTVEWYEREPDRTGRR